MSKTKKNTKSSGKKILVSKMGDYKRSKKVLVPPLGQINMSQIFWHKEMLPDFLWIDSLVVFYGEMAASNYFNRVLDVLDNYYRAEPILTGMISDFNLIDDKIRKEVLTTNKFLIEDAVIKPFGDIIRLYPECPMAWMLEAVTLPVLNVINTVEEAKKAVMRLYPAKDSHGGFVRALSLNRFFKHNKIKISSKMKDVITSIENYPNGDRYRAESFARTVVNTYYLQEREKDPDLGKWSKYFWFHNFKISKCKV